MSPSYKELYKSDLRIGTPTYLINKQPSMLIFAQILAQKGFERIVKPSDASTSKSFIMCESAKIKVT